MPKQRALVDRNFDDLAARFQRNVYGGLKGKIRLAVLQRDFARHWAQPPFVPKLPQHKPLRILDAGGGQGPFSMQFAQAGHELVLCDISQEMLKLARTQAAQLGVEGQVTLVQQSIQELSEQCTRQGDVFDVVLCHAVLEWVVNPEALLPALTSMVAPGGYLSLTYYNVHAMAYKNLLRGNFGKVLKQDYGGFRGSLSPINPLRPEDVREWVKALPLRTLCTSGIRVFHDNILDKELREQDPDRLLELELALSQQEPYRALGRYQHVLAQRL
jgi:S-adenosylmethionine-dependent methyltransferase